MIPTEKIKNDTEQLPDTEREVSEKGARGLGHTGLSGSEREDSLVPSFDVRVVGIEPAHYAPAGARPYEGTAKKGREIHDSPDQTELTSEYLGALFPESHFSYLGAGRYGIVMADETGKAFKVYRSALSYSRYEKEAGALRLLSDAGLAPKLHLFVDAAEEYRLDQKAYNYTASGFEDVQIPSQNSGKELPVMVMDKVDVAPLESATPQQLVDGFCKVADTFMKENIHAWDTEIMVDKATGEVIILDVGELSQKPFDDEPATPQARLSNDLEILRGIILDFGFSHHDHQIQNAYRAGGLDAVRSYLTQLTQKA
jgi:hypothetical protein